MQAARAATWQRKPRGGLPGLARRPDTEAVLVRCKHQTGRRAAAGDDDRDGGEDDGLPGDGGGERAEADGQTTRRGAGGPERAASNWRGGLSPPASTIADGTTADHPGNSIRPATRGVRTHEEKGFRPAGGCCRSNVARSARG